MRQYDGLFIFAPESGPEARKEEWSSLEGLIKKFKGRILEKNEWGKRPLGYEVAKHRDGYMIMLAFEMDPAQAGEFRRALELDAHVLKYMVTVKPVQKAAAAPKVKKAKAPARKTVAAVEGAKS